MRTAIVKLLNSSEILVKTRHKNAEILEFTNIMGLIMLKNYF